MEEELEIILRAVDDASSTFQSVSESAEEMGTSFEESATEGSTGFDELSTSAESATGSIQDVIDYCQSIDGSGMQEAAIGADDLEQESQQAAGAVSDLSTELGIINSGMLLQTAEQIGAIGDKAEGMAQDMNQASITVGQLATQTGIAEPQMVSLINNISNATFPNSEAMLYVKSLSQIGVESENLGQSATDLDKINDAFALGAPTVNRLGQELSVLGVDMNNVSSSFNALAYANANTVGGMDNFFGFLQKYDSQLNDLGYDVDQTAIIISSATKKFGGGRAAYKGLSDALKEADGDTRKLEESLGIQAGALDHASEVTGDYEGQLQALADEEAEHKTMLDQFGAAWEDISLSVGSTLAPLAGFVGFIGQIGSAGMTLKGLKELGSSLKGTKQWLSELNVVQSIHNAIEGEGAIASMAAALGITTEAAAAEGATVAFGGLAIAENAVLWPLLAIIAAAALVAVAIYEIGKSFGWWTDVGSMIDAIWAGLQRLWSAFINHPDVQAMIGALSTAWDQLSSAIGRVIGWLGSFFNLSTGGEFDIVRALIDGLSQAWETITYPLRTIISLLQSFIGIGQLVISGQLSLVQGVMLAWNMLMTALFGIFNTLTGGLLGWATDFISHGINTAVTFVNGFINNIKNMPKRLLAIFQKVLNNIISQGAKWVTQAKRAAQRLLNGVMTYVKQLPGKIFSYMQKGASIIITGAKSWASNAKKKGQDIYNGVTGAISDLPNKVYSKILSIGDSLTKVGGSLYQKGRKLGENIWNGLKSALGFGGASGGDFADSTGGEDTMTAIDLMTGQQFDINTGQTYTVNETTDINLNESIEFTFDFKNLPSDINEDKLLTLMEQFITDASVIKRLVNDPTFQKLDNKVKGKILAKAKRAKGA